MEALVVILVFVSFVAGCVVGILEPKPVRLEQLPKAVTACEVNGGLAEIDTAGSFTCKNGLGGQVVDKE